MLEMTTTDGDRGEKPCDIEACRRGRNATVVKYTEVTLVVMTKLQSSTDSAFQSCIWSSAASDASGIPFGPETPEFVTKQGISARMYLYNHWSSKPRRTQKVDVLLFLGDLVNQIANVLFRGHIAGADSTCFLLAFLSASNETLRLTI